MAQPIVTPSTPETPEVYRTLDLQSFRLGRFTFESTGSSNRTDRQMAAVAMLQGAVNRFQPEATHCCQQFNAGQPVGNVTSFSFACYDGDRLVGGVGFYGVQRVRETDTTLEVRAFPYPAFPGLDPQEEFKLIAQVGHHFLSQPLANAAGKDIQITAISFRYFTGRTAANLTPQDRYEAGILQALQASGLTVRLTDDPDLPKRKVVTLTKP